MVGTACRGRRGLPTPYPAVTSLQSAPVAQHAVAAAVYPRPTLLVTSLQSAPVAQHAVAAAVYPRPTLLLHPCSPRR